MIIITTYLIASLTHQHPFHKLLCVLLFGLFSSEFYCQRWSNKNIKLWNDSQNLYFKLDCYLPSTPMPCIPNV